MLLIDGWFDHHLDGLVKGYLNLSEEVKSKSRLVIGAWDHMGNSPGELEYPNNRIMGTLNVKAGLERFDYILKGKPYKHEVGSIDAYIVQKIGIGRKIYLSKIKRYIQEILIQQLLNCQ